MNCLYCSQGEAERGDDGLALCASCRGRFTEGPQAPPVPVSNRLRLMAADAEQRGWFQGGIDLRKAAVMVGRIELTLEEITADASEDEQLRAAAEGKPVSGNIFRLPCRPRVVGGP